MRKLPVDACKQLPGAMLPPRPKQYAFARRALFKRRPGLSKRLTLPQQLPPRFIRSRLPIILWLITHLPHFPIPQIHSLLLRLVHGTCSYTAKDTELVAAFINRPITVERLGDRQGMAAFGQLVGGDEFRRRPRTEAVIAGRLR